MRHLKKFVKLMEVKLRRKMSQCNALTKIHHRCCLHLHTCTSWLDNSSWKIRKVYELNFSKLISSELFLKWNSFLFFTLKLVSLLQITVHFRKRLLYLSFWSELGSFLKVESLLESFIFLWFRDIFFISCTPVFSRDSVFQSSSVETCWQERLRYQT